MISAEEAARRTKSSSVLDLVSELIKIEEMVKASSGRGRSSVTLRHLSEGARHSLLKNGYRLDEDSKSTEVTVSW